MIRINFKIKRTYNAFPLFFIYLLFVNTGINAATKIILKFDDLADKNNVCQAIPVMDYVMQKQVKAGFGAIADRSDATMLSVLTPYIDAKNEKGEKLFEIWHHGFWSDCFVTVTKPVSTRDNLHNISGIKIHPNPVDEYADIEFAIENSGSVSLNICDVNGGKIANIVNDNLEAGKHHFVWSINDDYANRVKSGLYIINTQSPDFSISIQMFLL